MNRNPFRLGGITLATLAALAPLSARSQQAAPDETQVQQVTVTATRRPEPLQKVPVAVSVVDGTELERANRNTLGAVASQVPSLNFRTEASAKDTSLFVRGVGTITTSPGAEPTVSTVVDGVVLARPGQALVDLLDLERVEVLRGPQGTLFGRNASAGVINIVTRAPSKELERYIDLSYFGGGNERRLRLGISGELKADVMRGSLTAMVGKYDGNLTNVATGKPAGGYDKKGIRGKLEITPSRDLKISLGADFLDGTDTSPKGVVTSSRLTAFPSGTVTNNANFAAALLPVVPSAQNRQININWEPRSEDTHAGLSAQVDWSLGAYTLTSITAYRTWDNTQFQDQDRLAQVTTAFAETHDRGDVAVKQTSQEFRLTSPKGGVFDYVAGLYAMRVENDETYRRDVTRLPSAGAALLKDAGVAVYDTRSTNAALFGEGTWHFAPHFRGVAGLRFTRDELSYGHVRTSTQTVAIPGVAPGVSSAGSTSKTATTGRIGPQYDFAPNLSSYLTYSRGYKGPAYNVFFNMAVPRDIDALSPELSDSVELGLKSTLLNNRLRLNVALFSTKYKNYQANTFDQIAGTVVTRLINAGDVSTKGIEVDFTARPMAGLTVSGAVANTKARIDHFRCPVNAPTSCNLDGYPLPYAPDWKAALQTTYRMSVGSGLALDLGADYSWQSKVQYDIGQFADTIQPAYGILNASIALSDPIKGWRAALLVKNVTDKSYASLLLRAAGMTRAVPRDDQRYVGVNLRYDF
ncbi:TonB-dependent receptor [Ideonella sp. A 288]|uniref:TonB-dependent receptor n=1 Tax=Ideonella sp. A 288 TaxID=1962181 RepID=UPI000B4B5368|nr:TonB-dependent receptor [Ideonella sp. A 288]